VYRSKTTSPAGAEVPTPVITDGVSVVLPTTILAQPPRQTRRQRQALGDDSARFLSARQAGHYGGGLEARTLSSTMIGLLVIGNLLRPEFLQCFLTFLVNPGF
jgi:hypothetical protein